MTSMKLYLRSFLGATDALTYYYGIIFVTLSEATILNCTTPLWTALIMIYILKWEPPSYILLL